MQKSPLPIGTLEEIQDWIISGTEHEIRFAVQGAERYSTQMIVELVEELSYEHEKHCESFLLGWLESLGPLERLPAVVAVANNYQLGFIGEQSEDQQLLRVLESTKPGIEELAEVFEQAHEYADDPDPSYTKNFTGQLLNHSNALRSAAEDIQSEVAALRHISEQVARIEKVRTDWTGKAAKDLVAEELEENRRISENISPDQ